MIETAQLQNAQQFLELGGFIKGVQVKTNSYYSDLDKQAVLKAIIIDRKNYPIKPHLKKHEKHTLLRKRATQFQND